MRKIVALTFLSLDGVLQAPGGPKEDTSGDFKYGGWTVPYFDESLGKVMSGQMSKPADLLLGRKTFEIFAGYWPEHEVDWPGVNEINKYVVSRTMKEHEWEHSVFLKDIGEIEKLKKRKGKPLHVYGSSTLLQTLLKHDLVDEYWLKIFPLVLGNGKRLFGLGTMPAAFKLTESSVTPAGVIVANYERAGKVKTGSFV